MVATEDGPHRVLPPGPAVTGQGAAPLQLSGHRPKKGIRDASFVAGLGSLVLVAQTLGVFGGLEFVQTIAAVMVALGCLGVVVLWSLPTASLIVDHEGLRMLPAGPAASWVDVIQVRGDGRKIYVETRNGGIVTVPILTFSQEQRRDLARAVSMGLLHVEMELDFDRPFKLSEDQ